MDDATRFHLLTAATDALGMYPAGDGAATERTAWQEGWNAALTAVTDSQVVAEAWFEGLPANVQQAVGLLLTDEMLHLNLTNLTPTPEHGEVHMLLNMNDTFGYAMADTEEVPVDEVVKVSHLWIYYLHAGLVAWTAIRRGKEPILEQRTPDYYAACKDLEAA